MPQEALHVNLIICFQYVDRSNQNKGKSVKTLMNIKQKGPKYAHHEKVQYIGTILLSIWLYTTIKIKITLKIRPCGFTSLGSPVLSITLNEINIGTFAAD